nr:hypothetical protein [Tanacetum cinerariifolium]
MMSAAMVCGKRSYFEEECESSPLVTKKLRFSCSTVTSTLVDRLIELYPNIHKQLLEKALQENGNNVDSVIRSFNQLCLGRVEGNSGSVNAATSEECVENSSANGNVPDTDCSQQQIEALMRENEALKEQNKILISKEKENVVLKEQNKSLMREQVALKEQNSILKRGVRENVALKELVTILKRGVVSKHEREKDLKKKVSTLEMMIYALTMQQKQAQEVDNSMLGRHHRDVF